MLRHVRVCASLALLVVACDAFSGDSGEDGPVSPTPAPPAPTPTPGAEAGTSTSSLDAARDLVVGRSFPSRILVDEGNVFWIDTDPVTNISKLMRARKGAPPLVVESINDKLQGPQGLVADSVALYVVDNSSVGSYQYALRQPKAGGASSALQLSTNGRVDALARHGTQLFYGYTVPTTVPPRRNIETLGSDPPLASTTRTNFAENVGPVVALAVDASRVYAGRTNDVVAFERATSVPRTPQVLAQTTAAVAAIVLDDTAVTWAEPTLVRRVPKGGGAVVDLATSRNGVASLAVDEVYVYWVEIEGPRGAVRRIPKAGGPIEDISTNEAEPSSIAVDDTGVYWTNRGDGRIRFAPRR